MLEYVTDITGFVEVKKNSTRISDFGSFGGGA